MASKGKVHSTSVISQLIREQHYTVNFFQQFAIFYFNILSELTPSCQTQSCAEKNITTLKSYLQRHSRQKSTWQTSRPLCLNTSCWYPWNINNIALYFVQPLTDECYHTSHYYTGDPTIRKQRSEMCRDRHTRNKQAVRRGWLHWNSPSMHGFGQRDTVNGRGGVVKTVTDLQQTRGAFTQGPVVPDTDTSTIPNMKHPWIDPPFLPIQHPHLLFPTQNHSHSKDKTATQRAHPKHKTPFDVILSKADDPVQFCCSICLEFAACLSAK